MPRYGGDRARYACAKPQSIKSHAKPQKAQRIHAKTKQLIQLNHPAYLPDVLRLRLFSFCGFAALRETVSYSLRATVSRMRDGDLASRVIIRFTRDNRLKQEKFGAKISCTYPNHSPSCLLALYAKLT